MTVQPRPHVPVEHWPSERGSRILLIVVVISTLLFAACGAAVWHLQGPLPIERHLLERFRLVGPTGEVPPILINTPHHPYAGFWVFFGEAGVFFPCVALLTLIAVLRRDCPLAAVVMVGPLAAEAFVEFIAKPIIGRHYLGHLGYPSGHTTGATALAAAAYISLARTGRPRVALIAFPLFAGIALATGVGVVKLHWHYPTDSIGGWAVGSGFVAGAAWLFFRRERVRAATRVSALHNTRPQYLRPSRHEQQGRYKCG